jgi:hypothetical protein
MKHLKKSFLVLGTIFLVSLFSSNLFAFEEKVTVYNNLDYPIIAVYRAAGYLGKYYGYYEDGGTSIGGNRVNKVKTAVEIPAHGSGYATFGAGTSDRHITIALPGESVSYRLLTSSSGYNRQGLYTNEVWWYYFVGKEIVLAGDSFKIDAFETLPIIAMFESHGCDPQFDVGLNRSGTLTVNDIHLTGAPDGGDGSILTIFDAYCDCVKTDSR